MPTIRITFSVCWLLALIAGWYPAGAQTPEKPPQYCACYTCLQGGIVRGDTTQKHLSLVFTADSYADGGDTILHTLNQYQIRGHFFFTGHFYSEPTFAPLIARLKTSGHYLGAHSNAHLLYCSWQNRDSLLVTRQQFVADLQANYQAMARHNIRRKAAPFFLPPFEWYNDSISAWTRQQGLQLINMTHGTLSHADYTTPGMPNYRSSDTIFQSIVRYEAQRGLNGFILLIHMGTHPNRTDKFYYQLPRLIAWLQKKGYALVPLQKLLPRCGQ